VKKLLLFSLLVSLLCHCSVSKPEWPQLTLSNLKDQPISLQQWQNKPVVFIFLSPECPLCQSYSIRINELQQEFKNDSLEFIGVVAGNFYPKQQIRQFLIKHQLNLTVLLDPDFKLTNTLQASITPEVFLTKPGGSVVYSGAIDNWAIDLGQKRPVISEHYLRNALISLRSNSPINPEKTKAIGCFIE